MSELSIHHSLDTLPDTALSSMGDNAQGISFFSSAAWFANLILHCQSDETETRIYCAISSTGDILLLPTWAPINPHLRFWRPLMALANYYTPVFTFISSSKLPHCKELLASVFRAIRAERPRWDQIDFHPMAKDGPAFAMLHAALEQVGFAVQTYFCFGNWYLPISGVSYHDYFLSLPGKLRNTLVRKEKQLASKHHCRFQFYENNTALDHAIADYEKIYRASWKQEEAHADFISGLIRTAAAHGKLRLGIAYIDEQAAAAQLWIIDRKIASIFKLAYDEQFSQFSIGSLLTAKMMEQAIDIDKVDEIDYLMGDDAYKRDWMTHRREHWGIVGFNRSSVIGNLLYLRHSGGRFLKKKLQGLIYRLRRPNR